MAREGRGAGGGERGGMADRRAGRGVLGIFTDPAAAAGAVRALRDGGFSDVRAAMPAAFHEVSEALGRNRSGLGPITMGGALLGTALGFALCVATSVSWPLVTGGKPIVSIPPFIVIAFELSVLIGALTNLGAFLALSRKLRRERDVPFDPRSTTDRIAVFAAGGDPAAAEGILSASGAEEVRRVG